MSTVRASGSFMANECYLCPVNNTCAAFQLVNRLEGNLEYRRHRLGEMFNNLVEDTASLDTLTPNNTDQRLAVVLGHLTRLTRKTEEMRVSLSDIVRRAVEAQGEEEIIHRVRRGELERTQHVIVEPKVDLLGDIVVEYQEELGPNPDITELDAIGTDVRYYASRGICGALDVTEIQG